MVAGLITNLSVCWVVVRHSQVIRKHAFITNTKQFYESHLPSIVMQARTARNLLIINLAISDISVCFVTMPFTMLRLINHTSWSYGDGLCRLTRYQFTLKLHMSVYTSGNYQYSVLFIRAFV